MLKLHVVRQGGSGYYVHDLVPGRAEGGRVAGESPGRWTGAGSAALGVTGAVEAQPFTEVLEGRHPTTGRRLRAPRGDRSVSGYDLTFCAPKSVSLLHLLAPGEIADQVGEGHHAAVADTADYLQRSAVVARRSREGEVRFLPTAGVVAGQFVHRTSRALDPHLHTHLVVANVTQGVDGTWSAVDSRSLFAHAPVAQALYHASLRAELSDRLGAAFDEGPAGFGDVTGVDPALRRLFSQRAAAIEEFVVRRDGPGSGRTGGDRVAFHVTRPGKDHDRTVEALQHEWRERAASFGFDLGNLTRVVGLGRATAPSPAVDPDRIRERLGELSLRRRPLTRRQVVEVVAGASRSGLRAREIESVAARVIGTSTDGPGWSIEPRWDPADLARGVTAAEGLTPDRGGFHRPTPDRSVADRPQLTLGR